MGTNSMWGQPPRLSTDANGNTVLVGAGESYAAIPVDESGNAVVTGGGGSLRDLNSARNGYGELLTAFTVAAGAGSANASQITDLSVTSPDPDYPGYVAKLNGTSPTQQAVYDHTPGSAIDMTGVESIGFWAMATPLASGEPYAMVKFLLGYTPWTSFAEAQFSIRADGRWRFYVAPSWAWPAWSAGTAITTLRLREGDGTTGRTPMSTTSAIYIGAIRKNPRGKAVGMIRFDDNVADLISTRKAVNLFTGNSGVTIAAGNYNALELVEAFGFKANCYILTDFVDSPGFETTTNLRALQDTYGWDICYQSKANPIGDSSGARLLGPIGYNLVPIGGVSLVDTAANSIDCAAAHGITVVGSVAGGVQPFPVEFIGTDLPAPLVTGTKYYLSAVNTTAFKVHTTAMGSATAADIVDLTTTGTAANFGVRYWGSANDHSAIQADFENGMAWMQAEGFKAYEHYALNQGAFDIYVEKAALAAGFKTAWTTALISGTDGGGLKVASFEPAFNIITTILPSTIGQYGCTYAPWLNIPQSIQTDGTPTASDVRAYVRKLVSRGAVGGNYHHALTTANAAVLLAYLDELKLHADRGQIDVLTVSEYYARREATV